jgi:NAD(P)-dependent dehydrogenase (short-subunit alcohol dehydrogenase family)
VSSSPHAVLIGRGDPADGLAAGLADAGFTVTRAGDDDRSRAGWTAALADAADRNGPIELIVHAWFHPATLERCEVMDLDEATWREAADGTIDAAYRLAQAAHPHLADTKGRLVYVVPSIGCGGAAGFGPASAAAESIRVLSKGLAKSWGRDGIRVDSVVVSPLVTLGEPGREALAGMSLSPPALGRPGDPRTDLAPVIALLCDDRAAFMTATTLVLDGGVWSAQ